MKERPRIEQLHPAAEAYIAEIPAHTWAIYAFPVSLGHITSNIVETMDAVWKKLGIRDESVPVLLNAIWEHMAKQMYAKSKMDMKGHKLTPCMVVIAELRRQAERAYTVESYADGVATVKKERHCSCCRHK